MVAAERHHISSPIEREVWPVRARKYGIDDRSPWYRKWYFKLIYLPFLRFSFKYMKIPATKEVTVEGKKVTFSWWEDQGIFETREQAEAACLGPMWSYKKLPLNRLLAKESAKYDGGDVYPRADKPERFVRPSFEIMTPRSLPDQINQSVKKLSRILDDE